MSDDEDFEELFSFGVDDTTGTTTAATSNPSAASDLDDIDIFGAAIGSNALSTPGASAASAAPTTTAATTATSATAPPLQSYTTTATPRSAADDFDDLFGTPPHTPATPKAPVDLLGGGLSLDHVVVDTPQNQLEQEIRVNDEEQLQRELEQQQHLSIDDFHVHDAGTRDFLEWLDDDTTTTTAKKKGANVGRDISLEVSGDSDSALYVTSEAIPDTKEGKKGGDGWGEDDDDDFDFDQMLAEADLTSSSSLPPSALESAVKSVVSKPVVAVSKPVVPVAKMEKPAVVAVQPKQQTQGASLLPKQPTQQVVGQSQEKVAEPASDDVASKVDAVKTTEGEVNVVKSETIVESSKAGESDEKTTLSETMPIATQSTNTTTTAPSPSTNNTDPFRSITPEHTSKPYKSACIEEELSFDQWDENEEDADFQIASAASNENEADGNGATAGSQEVPSSLSSSAKVFTSLSDAIRSNAATIDDVRTLFEREKGRSDDAGVTPEDRPHLWIKVICGKVLNDLENGSLADSFREWEKKNENSATYAGAGGGAMIEELMLQFGDMCKENASFEVEKKKLLSVLQFHDSNKRTDAMTSTVDPLIPPVANAILQAGVPLAAASVALSQIVPSSMPLLGLSHDERFLGVKALHSDFYLLACYHLPLLVIMHLDRNYPGWYWPRKPSSAKEVEDGEALLGAVASIPEGGEEGATLKDDASPAADTPTKSKRAAEDNGLVPISWFVTHFAGEFGKTYLTHKCLFPLWDNLLVEGDCSWKYFLAIALLDKHSDNLLMARGEELSKELEEVFDFKTASFDEESFVAAGSDKASQTSNQDNGEMVSEWLNSAKSLLESTPSSVVELLRSADDRAVGNALKVRQTQVDAKIKAQQDAHEAELKKERDERDAEAKKAMTKARLIAYYRNHNPEKVDTIDQIMKMFDGRMNVLNEKLKKKVSCQCCLPVMLLQANFSLSSPTNFSVWCGLPSRRRS